MISECFVYITLPGQTEMVTAGRYRLDSDGNAGVPRGGFIYGRSYLARKDAVEFDPRELKLTAVGVSTDMMGGVFGALRDAAPDAWGRRLIERHVGRSAISEIDYLLKSPDDRAGALGFGLNVTPPSPLWKFNQTVDLAALIDTANQIVSEDKDPEAKPIDPADIEQIERLIMAGTSMGGARPKATVEHDDALWLAKFPLNGDKWNNPRVEHAVMKLGALCGLDVAETDVVKVGERDVLLSKRFDRKITQQGYERHRMVSALTILGADETKDRKWSYVVLAEEMRRFASGGIDRQLEELFRRMTFNCLVSNTDDHPRNHAFIADGNGWRLSPAYDVTPTPMHSVSRRDLALEIGKNGRYANRENLLSEAARFRLSREDAAIIIDEMAEQVRSSWYSVARSCGVSELDCERISPAFVYEGFFYDLPDNDLSSGFRF